MVFNYSYCRWPKWQWYQHVPPTLAILMAMAVCRCNTKCIPQCSMSRATWEATGCCYQATTCSVLPQRPPGQKANKQQSTNTPKKVAMLMAAVVHQYNTTHIAQWRRSRALLEATGRCHQASIMSDNINWTWLWRLFWCFHCQYHRKRSQVNAKTPVFNRGMTYQTKEKGLTKVSI